MGLYNVDAAYIAHRHAERQSVTAVSALLVDHSERGVAAAGRFVGKIFWEEFRQRHPRLVRHALDMMTGFSTAPLQLASLIGFSCTLFGVGVFFYVFVRYCLEGSIPGFPFLASIIAIFSGAQLFALGVIGEYLARMHFRTMNQPPYAIRDVAAGENSKAQRE